MRSWWRVIASRRTAGTLLVAVGAGLTILLTYLGNTKEPPAASTQGLTALLAILAQLGGAWIFSAEGKADPTLAERSVGRLVSIAQRARQARESAELLHTTKGLPPTVRLGIGQLSVHLSYLEEGVLHSIDDWRTFHPKAVTLAEGGSSDDE